MSLLAGCGGLADDGSEGSSPSGTRAPGGGSTAESTTTATGNGTTELELLEDSYEGPLISAHEHFLSYRRMGEVLDWYVDWMAARGLEAAVSFLSRRRLELVSDHEGRFLPFDMGPVGQYVNAVRLGGDRDAPARTELAAAYAEELAAGSQWLGIGEFPLYMLSEPESEPPMPDAGFLQDVYEVGAEHGVTVMVHPPYDRQFGFDPWEGETESHPVYESLEVMLGDHPETEFLVHGIERANLDFVPPLLSAYENWIYDISGIVTRTGDPAFFTDFGLSPSEGESAQAAFVEGMSDERIRRKIDDVYATWEPILTEHPGRVVWGIDALFPWHYHQDVLDVWLKFFRGLLGRLSDGDARQVAYGNAAEAWR